MKKNILFACYKQANSNDVIFIAQRNNEPIGLTLNELLQKTGFVIYPFDKESKDNLPYFIFPDIQGKINDIDIHEIESLPSYNHKSYDETYSMPKAEYEAKLEPLIHLLKSDDPIQKVVFSRIAHVDKPDHFNESELFHTLTEKYTEAFCYILNIPNEGVWIGASPETLLNVEDNKAHTVALAGTQKRKDQEDINCIKWSHKDQEEQEYVTSFVQDILHQYNINDYTQSDPYTIATAKVVHLKTSFSFPADNIKDQLGDFILSLHPTPAVGGVPQDKAIQKIKEVEPHNREYYSGFLGPVNINNSSHLYVNLRCMKVSNKLLSLFIGGGITSQSIVENEWEETCLKAQTLLSVL
ncbi:MAG: isochorismate synthase [Hyphomicrobiales bacterium]